MVQLKKVLSGEVKVVKSFSPVTGSRKMLEYDVVVVTSGGTLIPTHSKILASASPVLKSIIERLKERGSSDQKIMVFGVPYDAVLAFIQFLYSFKCNEVQMEKNGVHLLALSHVYLILQLKQRCIKALSERLTIDNVVDVLQLARMCDAPQLYLKCMKLLTKNFKAAQGTDGWKFLQNHDPYLELEILQFIDETETRKKRLARLRGEQNMYIQLSEAMDCLEHICSEGCTSVGPCNTDMNKRKGQCSKFSTCHSVQLLIKHFGTCKKTVKGGCVHCKRLWQLFRLHSSICDQRYECRVPLCRQFKSQAQQGREGKYTRWRLLVGKVVLAKIMSSLPLIIQKKRGASIHKTLYGICVISLW